MTGQTKARKSPIMFCVFCVFCSVYIKIFSFREKNLCTKSVLCVRTKVESVRVRLCVADSAQEEDARAVLGEELPVPSDPAVARILRNAHAVACPHPKSWKCDFLVRDDACNKKKTRRRGDRCLRVCRENAAKLRAYQINAVRVSKKLVLRCHPTWTRRRRRSGKRSST